MDAPARQQSFRRKKIVRQLTGKRGDSPLHSAARAGNLEVALEIFTTSGGEELKKMLSWQNQSGETALYVAAEYGYVDIPNQFRENLELLKFGTSSIGAK